MDERTLQIFLAVDSNLSFTQTADEMHMSVSAVSRAIARLELSLGQRLFDRDRRGMRATSAAVRLRSYAENAVSEWRALQHSLRDGDAIAGELRIYGSVTASYRLLSPLLSAYRRACPAVDVRLQTGDQAAGVDRVLDGQADVAVIAHPESLPPALTFASLARTPLMLCLPTGSNADFPKLSGLRGYRLIDSLKGRPWILPERGVTRTLSDAWLRAHLNAPPEVYARVAGHEAIAAMVSLGLGVGIVPKIVAEAGVAASDLILKSLPDLPAIDIGVCTRRGRLSDPVVASLMDCVERASGHGS